VAVLQIPEAADRELRVDWRNLGAIVHGSWWFRMWNVPQTTLAWEACIFATLAEIPIRRLPDQQSQADSLNGLCGLGYLKTMLKTQLGLPMERSLQRPEAEEIREGRMLNWKKMLARFSATPARWWMWNKREGNHLDGNRNGLIKQILDIEWQMFSCLRAKGSSRNDHGERLYRTMRGRIHSILPGDVNESYLQDLLQAQQEGRNLIGEKFDRREGKRPPLKDHPLIPQIVEIECEWKRAMDQKKPPRSTATGDDKAFRLYVTTELETYSDRTLDLYYRAVVEARQSNRNLVEERYYHRTIPSSPPGGLDTKKRKTAAAHRAA
jgi:hypothetical protein